MNAKEHAARILLRCADNDNLSLKDSFIAECSEFNIEEDLAFDIWDQIDLLLDDQAKSQFKNV